MAETKRFVFRDQDGEWVETHICETREEAIRLFCYPALMWPPFERDGWTCTEASFDKTS
jgi:hypothetical protein